MRRCEHGAEHDAQSADDNVGNAQERVLATHDGACAEEDRLFASEFLDLEVWIDVR